MEPKVTLKLLPADITCSVPVGTPLRDVLYAYGMEFPCGGRGKCAGCRVKLLHGELPAHRDTDYRLTDAEIADGWRLACKHSADSDLVFEVQQWESVILVDDSPFTFVPSTGLGIGIDLGTTTLASQLLDLRTGHVLAVETAKNPQGQHGADIMSRVSYAVEEPGGREQLTALIRKRLGELIAKLLTHVPERADEVAHVTIVGNAPMHFLFAGRDVTPFSHYPFEAELTPVETFTPDELGWKLPASARVHFLPDLGGFVGSDVLAGVIATRIHELDDLSVLVDLGTNGEIVVGNRERLICASTAAGPAFEAAGIHMGMQATTGAISEVHVNSKGIVCHVLGGGDPRGICGSGLVDAAAAALELGMVGDSGRFTDGLSEILLADPVTLQQGDLRELQLAKGAIAAGIRILLNQLGKTEADVTRVYIAGAFGNYVRLSAAQRIGLLKFPLEKLKPVGNTALLGAKLALFMSDEEREQLAGLQARIAHLCLSADPQFQDIYVDEMFFS